MTVPYRPKVGDGDVMALAHRLTERDRQILTMLSRHRVFTTVTIVKEVAAVTVPFTHPLVPEL